VIAFPVTNQAKDVILFFVGELFDDQRQSTASEGEGMRGTM